MVVELHSATAHPALTCPVCGLPPDGAGPSGYVCRRNHTWPRDGGNGAHARQDADAELKRHAAARAAGSLACTEPEEEHASTWAEGAKLVSRVTWHWERWLAPGFMHLLCAYTGEGKSTLALRIATTYIVGWAWPDGTPFRGERGAVLWCEAEGAQALNYDRALAWGLPLDQLRHPLADPFRAVNVGNRHHREAMERAAQAPDVGLVVLDSLSAARPGRDENDSRCIADMQWLAALARDSGKPLLVLHHLRKRGLLDAQGVTLDRLRGSSGIPQLARVVWALSIPDPARPERLRLECVKNNLSKFPAPLGMTIGDDGVSFGEPPRAPVQLTDAQQGILDALGELGEATAADVARHVGADRGNTSRRLQALVKLGMVRARTLNTLPVYSVVAEQ